MSNQTGFKYMRNLLLEINYKMAKHRLLMDRYTGLEMKDDNQPIAERVASKVEELVPRVPSLSGVQHHFGRRSDVVNNDFDPRLVPVSILLLFIIYSAAFIYVNVKAMQVILLYHPGNCGFTA